MEHSQKLVEIDLHRIVNNEQIVQILKKQEEMLLVKRDRWVNLLVSNLLVLES